MNLRGAPIAIGAVSVAGLIAGLTAASSDGTVATVAAVLAAVAALGAGALAIWSITVHQRRVAESAAAAETSRQAEIAERDRELRRARSRIAELETTVARRDADASEARPSAADTTALTDPESQLFSEAYFRVALDARIASARRHLRPVAVALIEVFEGLATNDALPAQPARAAESIRQTIRDADTACRLTDGVFAVILEDTPENGAVWTVERVRRNLVSRFGSHTMWAGVACYPAHAFSTEDLLAQARSALDSAREWKQDRIEVAISE